MESVAFFRLLMLMVLRSRLFWMLKRPTVCSWIPFRSVRPVLVMLTSPALVTPLAKLRDWSLGRASQLMPPTESSSAKSSRVRVVRPSRSKTLPMLVREEAVIELTLAPWEHLRPPVIFSIPLRLRSPLYDLSMVISPLMVEQELMPSASLWVLILVSLQSAVSGC